MSSSPSGIDATCADVHLDRRNGTPQLASFYQWLDSLSEKALYKSLIAAHTAAQLEDGDGFALHLHDAIGDM